MIGWRRSWRTVRRYYTLENERNGVTTTVRNDWTLNEVKEIYNRPLLELVYEAATVHRKWFKPNEVQQCTLLSIKTGGCTEDCKYCSQSSSYKTFVKPTPRMKYDEVIAMAKRAKSAGSTRLCMGSAWREIGKKNAFKHVLKMVKDVNAMGLEVCCTLGMLTEDQAVQLKEAGLMAYNHNLDTSREYYSKIVSTRTYEDRLSTIKNVRKAGISVCCGGILGIGEETKDRIELLHTLCTMEKHPESVPINALVPVPGTPLYGQTKEVTAMEMARTIAAARILMPATMVRLSAGRKSFTFTEQGMLFMAGANSIFSGDTLLTTDNADVEEDTRMFQELGIVGKPSQKPPVQYPYVAVSHTVADPDHGKDIQAVAG